MTSGRVGLVTGAASGFGREVARQLAARGDALVLVDLDEEGGRRVAAETGGTFLPADVSSYQQVMKTTADAEALHGRLDLVFLNAGISTGFGLGDDFDPDGYRRAMGVNLDGVVFGVHAALPALRRAGGGAIVCTASLAGLTGTPFDPVYGANKHAVVGLVRSLGPALAPSGIRVNAFCPAFAETAILGPLRELLVRQDIPIIPVQTAGAAVLAILDSGETGQAFLLQAGHELAVYRFRGVPAAVRPDGSKAVPDVSSLA